MIQREQTPMTHKPNVETIRALKRSVNFAVAVNRYLSATDPEETAMARLACRDATLAYEFSRQPPEDERD